ncbi:MAG TPA: hypothetical protein VHE78_11195 [Gemmatimonadaceae bacterium]|nr:hypothetical protein [Gemmatimonadaceae bacterium]
MSALRLAGTGIRKVERLALTANGTAIVVALGREGLIVREKGRRTRFILPYGAVRLEVARRTAERSAARGAGKPPRKQRRSRLRR